MPNYSVGLQQLITIADYFEEAAFPYFEELREAFRLLRVSGCRINEIFEIERWEIVSGYQVSVIPQKSNSIRFITLDSTFDNFINAISGQYSPFLGRTTSQFWYIFNKINPYGKIYSETKEITAYFYRYLYLRTLSEDGLTIAQIADIMGYGSETAVHNYLDAVLTSTIEIPNPPSDTIEIAGDTYTYVVINGKRWLQQFIRYIPAPTKFKYANNDASTLEAFGVLMNQAGLAEFIPNIPAGWRIPTDPDIVDLNNLFGDFGVANKHYKSNEAGSWNTVANNLNDSGLSLMGAGWNFGGTVKVFKSEIKAYLYKPSAGNYTMQLYTKDIQQALQRGGLAYNNSVYCSILLMSDSI